MASWSTVVYIRGWIVDPAPEDMMTTACRLTRKNNNEQVYCKSVVEKKSTRFFHTFLSVPRKYLPLRVHRNVSHSHQTQSLKCQLLPGLHMRRERQIQNPLFPCVHLLIGLQCRGRIWYTYSTLGRWNARSAVLFFFFFGKCTDLHIFQKETAICKKYI